MVVRDFRAARDVKVTQTGQFADFHFYLDTEPKLDFVYELPASTTVLIQDLPPELVSIYPLKKARQDAHERSRRNPPFTCNNREPEPASREGRHAARRAPPAPMAQADPLDCRLRN